MEDNQNSEFIRRVVDFARYMEKEYVNNGEGKCLLISAGDRNTGIGKQGMVHAIVGNKEMVIANFASMMKQKEIAEIFRLARIAHYYVDDLYDVASDKRHRLRVLYGCSALSAFWVWHLLFWRYLECVIGLRPSVTFF